MDYKKFYTQLFEPLAKKYGALDKAGMFHIVGFDCGGPINFSTIGRENKSEFITYITCELSVRDEQHPASFGRFELACTSDNQSWVRTVLTSIARMSLECELDHHHTIDVGQIIDDTFSTEGVLLEKMYDTKIDGKVFGVLNCIGITRAEMEAIQQDRGVEVLNKLKHAGIYPKTIVQRESII